MSPKIDKCVQRDRENTWGAKVIVENKAYVDDEEEEIIRRKLYEVKCKYKL